MFKKIPLLLFFGLVISAPLRAQAAPKYDIVVPRDYKTVGEAVERGMPGDRIGIGEGTYDEKAGIKLKTDMKLIGAGADKTILKIGSAGILVNMPNETLYNIAIKDLGLSFHDRAILVSGVNGFTISGCLLTSGGKLTLLEIGSSVNVKVANCTLANSESGISLRGRSVEIAVRNSIFYNNKTGIRILPEPGSKVPASTGQTNTPGADTPLVLAYNDFYNAMDFENCQKGEKDITKDPEFVAPREGNFHLNGNSPCIDAGDPDTKYNDPDGSRNDIGALPYSGKNNK